MTTQPTAVLEVDQFLAAWDERLRRMDENLVALESEAIYQILAGKAGKRPVLEGVTRDRVTPAIDAVTELFENRDRLAAVIAKAKEIRATISALTFWDTDEKLAEIRTLLLGPSIELGPKVIALSERNLLDVGFKDVLLEPDRLLAEMVRAFEKARTTLLAVSRAWESLDPAMNVIEKEMTALRQMAAEVRPLGADDATATPELAEADAELANLRSHVQRDPLGVDGNVQREMRPRLVALRARLETEAAARGRALASLELALDLRKRIDETHEKARLSHAQASLTLEEPHAGQRLDPVDRSLITGLDQWLAKIELSLKGRRWSPAEIGLSRWREAAQQYLARDEAVLAHTTAQLNLKSELEGRLTARRAQAATLAARGQSIDPSLEARAQDADEILRRRPTPLAEASAAVAHYEAAVVALRGR